ncbi:MAG: protoporphyrinogen oxidase [Planctomycetes bacterium]|nr:protoporphyrinogen oxidase [Planctomycetota bacterium]
MTRPPRVVVIGGGISGLACAFRLRANGVDVEVLERDGTPGGVMRTRLEDGFLTEAGPNSFQSGEEILSLVHDAGLDADLLRADSRLPRYVYFGGRLHAAPMGPGALFGTKLLSFGAKVRLFREPWVTKNPDGHEESIREFVTRRFGPAVHDVLIAPLVSGIYAGDTSRLSMQSVFPLMAELEAKHGSLLRGFLRHGKARRAEAKAAGRTIPKKALCSFSNGLGVLPARLAERLGGDLHLRSEVMALRSHPGGFAVDVREAGVERTLDASRLVIATHAPRAGDLLCTLGPSTPVPSECCAAADVLRAIEMPPLASVCLAFRKADVGRALAGFGFLVPRGSGVRMLGCIWSSSLFPGRAPDGWILVTCFVGGATDVAVRDLSDAQVVDSVRADLVRTLAIAASPRVLAVNRYAAAIPQYTLGHRDRMATVRRAISRVPGLHLTGNYLGGVSVGDCVRQAYETASEVIRDAEVSVAAAR